MIFEFEFATLYVQNDGIICPTIYVYNSFIPSWLDLIHALMVHWCFSIMCDLVLCMWIPITLILFLMSIVKCKSLAVVNIREDVF